jgi:hypothetical protein
MRLTSYTSYILFLLSALVSAAPVRYFFPSDLVQSTVLNVRCYPQVAEGEGLALVSGSLSY